MWELEPVVRFPPIDSVPDFLKLPPVMYLSEVSGVAVSSKVHVFVFQRGHPNGHAYAVAVAQVVPRSIRSSACSRDRLVLCSTVIVSSAFWMRLIREQRGRCSRRYRYQARRLRGVWN